jgi:hypothetical protein
MICNELISFIAGARRTGAGDKLIIKGLLDVGWQRADISETLAFLGEGEKKKSVHEKEEISLVPIAVVIIFLFGAELCARVLGFSFLALLF